MARVFLSVLFLVFTIFQALTSARSPLPPFPGELSKEKVCFYNGELYKPGKKFANRDCTGWCMCDGESGSLGCVSLCPPSPPPVCGLEELLKTEDVLSADPTRRCKCKRQFCAPRPPRAGLLRRPFPPIPVLPDCKNRAANEWFNNDSCTGRCKCTNGGHSITCVSLCPPMAVRCSSDMEKEYFEEVVGEGERCTCKRERCVQKIGVWQKQNGIRRHRCDCPKIQGDR